MGTLVNGRRDKSQHGDIGSLYGVGWRASAAANCQRRLGRVPTPKRRITQRTRGCLFLSTVVDQATPCSAAHVVQGCRGKNE